MKLAGYCMLFLFLTLAALSPIAISGCKEDDTDELLAVGNWVKLSDFEGWSRTEAIATAVGGYGYMGTGINVNGDRLTDFWIYDPARDRWTQIADFTGTARTNAVSFAADDKVYVGTGFDAMARTSRLKDFYEFDPSTNAWTRIPDLQSEDVNNLEAPGREGAVAFSLNDIGYVGCGVDGNGNYLKDFYAYDPKTKKWSQKKAMGGSKRRDAVAFVIGNEAYVVTGANDGVYVGDFWKYKATSDDWTQLRSVTDAANNSFDDKYIDIVRNNAVAFTSNGKGYVATGGKNTAGTSVWEYDPSTDLWAEKTSFEGAARYNAVAFTIDNVGYVTNGRNNYYFDDVWRFEPNSEQNDYDNGL